MVKRTRFHLDENVDPDIAVALQRIGVDVTTSRDSKLQGELDDVQLEFAYAQQRVLVTHDADFLRMAERKQHFGIAYCEMNSRSVGTIIRNLQLIYEVLERDEMIGRIEFL